MIRNIEKIKRTYIIDQEYGKMTGTCIYDQQHGHNDRNMNTYTGTWG
jgi:hypothetical protein